MNNIVTWVVFGIFVVSCGALPRYMKDAATVPIVETASMSGIVVTLSENRTSSSLHYYDLKNGLLAPLIGGESGDVFTAWLDQKLFVFNRGSGRVSFSYLSPAKGAASRSIERATPGSGTYDPVAAAMTKDGDLLLANNSGGSVVVSHRDDNSVQAVINDVDTGVPGVPFRPADIIVDGNRAWISHQSLDGSYAAVGGGKVFPAAASGGVWGLESKVGYTLTISNPVYMALLDEQRLLLAGVCYDRSPTSTCVSGIDTVDRGTGAVTHLSAWDSSKWTANGVFFRDLTDSSLLVCVIAASGGTVLGRYDLVSGNIEAILSIDGPGCGGVVSDRASGLIFVGEKNAARKGSVAIINRSNELVNRIALDHPVSGMTATYGH